MKKIPFVKYTSYGNNFVILDEITDAILSEKDKKKFAYQATDICFGVGSDNLLVIQPCRRETLQAINAENRYWETPPDPEGADFIFRMFEPNGEEALCCGNGLMSIASYLNHRYGISETRIMTEIPLAEPNKLSIGASEDSAMHWANMGEPRRTPPGLVGGHVRREVPGYAMDRIEDLRIEFRHHDLSPISSDRSLTLSGYLVFTGEPHLVVMIDDDLSLPVLGDVMFAQQRRQQGQEEKRANFGTWLIDHIGHYINRHHQEYFPFGVNVNFVRIDKDSGEVMFRCFERGINHETLACGTGALACAYVVKALGAVARPRVVVQPHRCNWYQPDARIVIEHHGDDWSLSGSPIKLLEGVFAYTPPLEQTAPAVSGAALNPLPSGLLAAS